MKIFGSSNEVQKILYKQKYGAWYFEKAIYFEQFLSFTQGKFTVAEYTDRIQALHNLCALDESPTHDLAQSIRGLRPDILENMNHSNTIQEAYSEAIHAEHTLRQSHMPQSKSQEGKFQPSAKAHRGITICRRDYSHPCHA